MMVEAEEQVKKATGDTVNVVVAPVGVGSFAQSVVGYWKSRPFPCSTITVEPNNADCLQTSLFAGENITVDTGDTIMSGLNCGTVSIIAWPILKPGVDVSVSIKDSEADQAVQTLEHLGVAAGPCGAATLAAFEIAVKAKPEALGPLSSDSVVILFCTEGKREYEPPLQPAAKQGFSFQGIVNSLTGTKCDAM
jgi:diaminopropionate ammonia-lyase